jgi:oxygen-dependent protoporphyrinogen oxidase
MNTAHHDKNRQSLSVNNKSNMNQQKPTHVVIIGGGIAGLSTAWYLQKQARKQGLNLRYTVLEGAGRWGGKILSDKVDGPGDTPFVVEGGPDSFLTQKPWALQLSRELGLEDQLLGTNDRNRKVFVLNKGKPTPLPDGVLLIVPTKVMPFALSPLLSPLGKLRMGLDLVIPAKRDGEDETLADFITRRLGREALDKIAEPLMSGIYNAEAERQSLLATFPRFRALEEKHGSLIKGMLASRRARRNGASARPTEDKAESPATSMFVSLRGGTEDLIHALVADLDGDLRLNTEVSSIRRAGEGFELAVRGESPLMAEAVVLAIPSFIAARLIQDEAPEAAKRLEAIRYVSTGTISLAYKEKDLDLLKGFGLVIPRSEERPINAVTLTSTKFDHRAPEGRVLMRVFFGGSRSPHMMDKDDDEIVSIARDELRNLLGIEASPIFHRIYRWQRANPQYDVGHLKHIEEIDAGLPEGLYVTGSPYRGIGLPDCVHQGQQTATLILAETFREEPEPVLLSGS